MEDTLVKRVLPHSIEAEQSVIGSMLYSPDAIADASEILNGEDFYQLQYGVIFDTIVELHQTGKATDIVTIQNALKAKNVAPEIYSIEFLKDLLNSVFTAANIKSYAGIVREKSLLRKMIKTMDGLTNECYLGKQSTDDLMEMVEKQMFDLLERRQDSVIQPIRDIMISVINKIDEAAKNGGAVTGIPTGFTGLDNMLTGLHPSELILIAGRPAMGKTAFALSIADYIAVKKQIPVAIFELEMDRTQLVSRILSMETHVDSQKIRTGQLNAQEWDEIVTGSSIIANSKLVIDDTGDITITELRNRCRKYKLEYGIQAIVIDYLQLMNGSGRKGENRQQEVSEITRALKLMARELQVPVIVLSQLSRGPEQRKDDHRPMLADLRESGAIEQDADVVMFIYRDEVYNKDTERKGVAEIIVAKQRSGPIGTVDLAWIASLTKFANMENQYGGSNQNHE